MPFWVVLLAMDEVVVGALLELLSELGALGLLLRDEYLLLLRLSRELGEEESSELLLLR